ncbi:hypothetical protein A0H81_01203 [Grifola frondosa]|uniref:Uncharacterized protein n=1 Tax=Grifola frondosa TaxID=5627 RepID=A0A1C7MSV9_GRIFR|nr:hypothetical protein A0H81_01203 [Grifola frondosa]
MEGSLDRELKLHACSSAHNVAILEGGREIEKNGGVDKGVSVPEEELDSEDIDELPDDVRSDVETNGGDGGILDVTVDRTEARFGKAATFLRRCDDLDEGLDEGAENSDTTG